MEGQGKAVEGQGKAVEGSGKRQWKVKETAVEGSRKGSGRSRKRQGRTVAGMHALPPSDDPSAPCPSAAPAAVERDGGGAQAAAARRIARW